MQWETQEVVARWGGERGKGVTPSVSMAKSTGVSRSPDESGWDGVNP